MSLEKKSTSYFISKMTIVVVIVLLCLTGIFGASHFFKNFVMSDFVDFLKAYSGYFIAFVSAIAAGGTAKNYLKKKGNEVFESEEDIVKSGEV